MASLSRLRWAALAALLGAVPMFFAACGDDASPPATTELARRCQLVPSGWGPSGTTPVDVEIVARGLAIPWGVQWLPDGDMIVTQRGGDILRVRSDGSRSVLARIPNTDGLVEGGLLGIALHPRFEENRWFYVYYTQNRGAAFVNLVERWILSADGASARADRIVVDAIPALLFHNGGRLRFGPDGHLYIGTGDAGVPELSQDPGSLAGKILRMTDEGEIPADNPIPGSAAYVLGVRNTQGFDWRADGRLVMTDHGPSGLPVENGRTGHDEINVVEPGDNLGWPVDYACEDSPGFVPPSMTWRQPLPPGGTAIYTGSEIPEWRGDVFIGALGTEGQGHLHRVRLSEDGNVERSETYFLGDARFGRLRDVVMGPDGGLYFTTSRCDGRGVCGDGDLIVRVGRRS